MFAYYISLKIVFGRASFPHNGDIRVGFPGGGSLWSPELLSAARAAGCGEALASPCGETAALGCGRRRAGASAAAGLVQLAGEGYAGPGPSSVATPRLQLGMTRAISKGEQ